MTTAGPASNAAAIIQRAKSAPFGSVLAETMSLAWYRDGAWTPA